MAKDYFIMDCETHPLDLTKMPEFEYFDGFKKFMGSLHGSSGPVRPGMEVKMTAGEPFDDFVANMDNSGVDVACVIPEKFFFTSGGTIPWATNGWMLKGVERYPDRLVLTPNFGPIIQRGVKNAIEEMVQLANENGVKVFKFYCPEDTYINDERLWPFYAKAQELGLVMEVHTGAGWVWGAKNKYCHPGLLEDVCYDFPDLRIVAFHFGYPHHRELNMLAGAHANLHVSLSYLQDTISWRPRFFEELLGECMLQVGVDKIVWGTDNGQMISFKPAIDAFKAFQVSEEGHKGWGYPYLTEEDKAKIFGLNLAKLVGIEPTKRARTRTK